MTDKLSVAFVIALLALVVTLAFSGGIGSTFLGLSDVESTTYNGHAGECPWSSMS